MAAVSGTSPELATSTTAAMSSHSVGASGGGGGGGGGVDTQRTSTQTGKGPQRRNSDDGAEGDLGSRTAKCACTGDYWWYAQLFAAVVLTAVGASTVVTALVAKKIALISLCSLAPTVLSYGKFSALIGAVATGSGIYWVNSLRA